MVRILLGDKDREIKELSDLLKSSREEVAQLQQSLKETRLTMVEDEKKLL
jgi:hypothetical protein